MMPLLSRLPRFRPAALIGALFLAAGCASLRSGSESDLLATVEAAAHGADAADTAWPGYRPFERGFIVFSPGRGALLVATAAPPSPWISMQSDEPRLRGRLYQRSDDLPGLTGGIDTGYRVGELRYPAIESDGDVTSTLVTLYHEAFHAWQTDSAFVGLLPEHLPPEAIAPVQVAAIELERRLLAGAVESAPGPSADSLIAAFLAVRANRLATLPVAAAAVDRSLERHEGLAYLVGYQAAAAALGLDSERVRRPIVAILGVDLARYGDDRAARYYRWRAYGTGAAIGFLLDQLGVEWRARTAGGAPLDLLLLAAARVPPSASLVDAARARFGYDALLGAAEADVAPTSDDPIADFLALEPHRLVVEIVAEDGFEANMSFTPGGAGFATPLPTVTVMPNVERASMTSSAFDLSVTGRNLMMDGRDPLLPRFVVLLPFPPRVDGEASTTQTGPIEGAIRITGEDTELIVRGEHLLGIDVEPGIVTVRVRGG